jgi:hypothetical protein
MSSPNTKAQFNLHVGGATFASYNKPVHFDVSQVCQRTWSTFAIMSDSERNMLLKGTLHMSYNLGLLARCGTNQVEYICMSLNLRGAEKDVSGKTFSLHPSEYATKTARSKTYGKKERTDYQKPWRQVQLAPIKNSSDMIVDSSGINKNFRQLLPGKDFNELLQYFFPKEMNSDGGLDNSAESEPIMYILLFNSRRTNGNMYTKLFNSQFEIDKISSQVSNGIC